MTYNKVEILLDKTNGVFILENIEHAENVILKSTGVLDCDRLTMGDIFDRYNPRKTASTNVQITRRTFEGKIFTHAFFL